MRRFGRILGKTLLVLFLLFLGMWFIAPKEKIDREIAFDPSVIGQDLQAWLDKQESQISNISPAAAKQIHWAGDKGVKTPWAVIYLHGFSATAQEIRPVPDDVASALGANLFFTRLTGHGMPGEALASATPGDWIEDVAEAMEIGRRLGERVVIVSTSTGSTLAAIAAIDPVLSKDLAGIVMVSPNFGLKPAAAKILDLPFARVWGPVVAGETRSFTPQNEAHGAHWTTSYPTAALFGMSALAGYAYRQDYSGTQVPVLALLSLQDQVVDPDRTKKVLSNWGAPVTIEERVMGPGDDPYSHVIAGDILSPGQTAATTQIIVDWTRALAP